MTARPFGAARRTRWAWSVLAGAAIGTIVVVSGRAIANAGASALLHPARLEGHPQTPSGCVEAPFEGAGVMLRGWRCTSARPRRGTMIYLHGVADTRGSGSGIADHFIDDVVDQSPDPRPLKQ